MEWMELMTDAILQVSQYNKTWVCKFGGREHRHQKLARSCYAMLQQQRVMISGAKTIQQEHEKKSKPIWREQHQGAKNYKREHLSWANNTPLSVKELCARYEEYHCMEESQQMLSKIDRYPRLIAVVELFVWRWKLQLLLPVHLLCCSLLDSFQPWRVLPYLYEMQRF